MDLSLESCKYLLRQIDKTVKIFENVAFSGSQFFKSIYLLQARNISILDSVSTSYSLCQSFIISLNMARKQGIEFKFTK